MLGHFGFSYVGLIYLVMLLVPNILWTKYRQTDGDDITESRVLVLLERIGQASCFCLVLIFSDFNLAPFTPWSLWLIASFLLMVGYEICWVRYFTGEHIATTLYRSFLGIPLPLATLPVTAFLLLGVYGRVIWLIVAAVVLGVGHVGVHVQHYRALK